MRMSGESLPECSSSSSASSRWFLSRVPRGSPWNWKKLLHRSLEICNVDEHYNTLFHYQIMTASTKSSNQPKRQKTGKIKENFYYK